MSKAKFKIGDEVRIDSLIPPEHNIGSGSVTHVSYNAISRTYYYRIDDSSIIYGESALHRVVTNEYVLAMFLKKHRKLTTFKRDAYKTRRGYSSTPKIKRVITNNFTWAFTNEGHAYWENLQREWYTLCDDLRLEGVIDLKKL